jgi:hypothetical protein
VSNDDCPCRLTGVFTQLFSGWKTWSPFITKIFINHLETIMLKVIAAALVAGSFVLTAFQDASAGDVRLIRHRKYDGAACVPQQSAPAVPAAPVVTPKSPAVETHATPPATARSAGTQYRSYSYDSAPAYQVPAVRSYSRTDSWQENPFRADHKLRGW